MEERKTNKKSRAVIIAAMLLLLIGILCLCGVTFAKYITGTGAQTQQATVAKWGYIVNANTADLFGKNYSNNTIVADTTASGVTVDVKSTADPQENIVAPGKSGKMTFGVSGSAEVLAKLTFDFTVTSDISLTYKANASDTEDTVYSPVKWTLTKKAAADGTDTTLVNGGTLTAVKTELDKLSGVIEAGESVNYTYELSWAWAFHVDDVTDKLDTLLGYAAMTSGTYENGTVVVSDNGNTVTVTNADKSKTVYTAKNKIEIGLAISVAQIQDSDRPTTGA